MHRFPIGTQFITTCKADRGFGRRQVSTRHTITEQLTVTNSKGEVVRVYYQATHEFCGQAVTDPDVCDTTIARNLAPEFRHLCPGL